MSQPKHKDPVEYLKFGSGPLWLERLIEHAPGFGCVLGDSQ